MFFFKRHCQFPSVFSFSCLVPREIDLRSHPKIVYFFQMRVRQRFRVRVSGSRSQCTSGRLWKLERKVETSTLVVRDKCD